MTQRVTEKNSTTYHLIKEQERHHFKQNYKSREIERSIEVLDQEPTEEYQGAGEYKTSRPNSFQRYLILQDLNFKSFIADMIE